MKQENNLTGGEAPPTHVHLRRGWSQSQLWYIHIYGGFFDKKYQEGVSKESDKSPRCVAWATHRLTCITCM